MAEGRQESRIGELFSGSRENQNWINALLAVFAARKGLLHFVSHIVTLLQRNILDNIRKSRNLNPNATCNECTLDDILGREEGNGNGQSSSDKLKRKRCPNNICNDICKLVVENHRFANCGKPSWKNIDLTKWCANPWELAKCYMPPEGYANVISADDTDFNGVINVIINCKHFKHYFQQDIFKKGNICEQINTDGFVCTKGKTPEYEYLQPKEENWAKAIHAAAIAKHGLKTFITDVMKTFHNKILRRVGKKDVTCDTCRTENVVPCPTNVLCNKGACRFHKTTHHKQCKKGICNIIFNEIKRHHSLPNPSWANTNAQKWCREFWEVTKCYLPTSGTTYSGSIESTDCYGFICLMTNCKEFERYLKDGGKKATIVCSQAKKLGKSVKWSHGFTLSATDYRDYLETLIALLQVSKESRENDITKKCIGKLEEMHKEARNDDDLLLPKLDDVTENDVNKNVPVSEDNTPQGTKSIQDSLEDIKESLQSISANVAFIEASQNTT